MSYQRFQPGAGGQCYCPKCLEKRFPERAISAAVKDGLAAYIWPASFVRRIDEHPDLIEMFNAQELQKEGFPALKDPRNW
jgi:hypothetical protein